jgi:hypothetical protein
LKVAKDVINCTAVKINGKDVRNKVDIYDCNAVITANIVKENTQFEYLPGSPVPTSLESKGT